MNEEQSFGALLKKLRVEAGLSLRDLAVAAEYDVSNLSKIERGLLPPPAASILVRKWLKIMGINSAVPEYQLLIDLAAAGRTVVPDDLREKDVAEYLPAFYRTIRNQRADSATFDELVKLLKRS